jgi:hypothetical protein
MKLVTPNEAIRAIPDGSIVIFPHGCVEPTTLYTAFQEEIAVNIRFYAKD